MTIAISFHELAESELNDAATYFENETEGLGFRFLAAVEASVAQIQQHPESSPIIDQDVRQKVVRRFPYNIMYFVATDRIRILAVASQRRRPFYWRGRT